MSPLYTCSIDPMTFNKKLYLKQRFDVKGVDASFISRQYWEKLIKTVCFVYIKGELIRSTKILYKVIVSF